MTRCMARSPAKNRARSGAAAALRPDRAHGFRSVTDGHGRIVLIESGDQAGHRRHADAGHVAGDHDGGGTDRQRSEHAAERSLARKFVVDVVEAEAAQRSSITSDRHHRRTSGGCQDIGNPAGHRYALDQHRRLVCAHAPAGSSAQHRTDRGARHARPVAGQPSEGMPLGSSCCMNTAIRSASSCSPIAAAISRRPRKHREESSIGVVCPAHVAGSAPTVGAQCVETTVVSDSKGCVALDLIAPHAAQRRPGVQ